MLTRWWVFPSLATASAGFRFSASFAAFWSSFPLSFLAFASSRSWRTLAVSASRAAFTRNLSCCASSLNRAERSQRLPGVGGRAHDMVHPTALPEASARA